MLGFSFREKFYLETDKGEKIECKCANHCLCFDCCRERAKINDMILHQNIKFVYFPKVTECPFGSNFLKKNKVDVERWEKQGEAITKLCDSIESTIKGIKDSDK